MFLNLSTVKSKGEESRVRLAGDCNHWMSKMVHAHLDDTYTIARKIFDLDLIFGVWVGHGVEQFPIENQPGAILAFT
jgi:hypothetical protein